MVEQLKGDITLLLENSVRQQLGTSRVIKTWDGRVKSVTGKYGPFKSNMIASGELYDSVQVNIIGDMGEGDFSIEVSFSPNDYWYYLQNGRQPGQEVTKSRQSKNGKSIQYKSYTKIPPLDSIKNWLRDKPVTQYRNKLGQFLSRDTQAFMIGRAIARDGQYPYDFLGIALEKSKKELVETIRDYATTVFRGLIIKNISIDIE